MWFNMSKNFSPCGGCRCSKEQRVAAVRDDINADVLPDDFHRPQILGGDGHYQNAVAILVGRLHLRQVALDLVELRNLQVGQKNRLLNARAALALKVFHHVTPNFIAFNIIHYKKQHPSYSFLGLVYQT